MISLRSFHIQLIWTFSELLKCRLGKAMCEVKSGQSSHVPCPFPQSVAQGGYPQPLPFEDCPEDLSHLRYTGQWQWSIEKFQKGAAGCWLGRWDTLKLICHRRAMASVRKQELSTQHALWDKTDTKGHSCGISLNRASTTNKSVRAGGENVSRGWRGRNRQQQQLPYFASVINAMGLYKAKRL